MSLSSAKVRIICEISKKYLQSVNAEDAAVAQAAALAGGKDFDVSPTSVKGISQGYDVAEFEDRAVGFPHGNIDGVAGVEHRASGGDMYCVHRGMSDEVMRKAVGNGCRRCRESIGR